MGFCTERTKGVCSLGEGVGRGVGLGICTARVEEDCSLDEEVERGSVGVGSLGVKGGVGVRSFDEEGVRDVVGSSLDEGVERGSGDVCKEVEDVEKSCPV